MAFRKSEGVMTFRDAGSEERAAGPSRVPPEPQDAPGAQPDLPAPAAVILSGILASPADQAVFVTDASGGVSLWSRAAAALYGLADTAVLGKLSWWDVCEPAGEPPSPQAGRPGRLRPPLDAALRRGVWRGPVRRPAGGAPLAEAVVTPLRGDGGGPAGFLTVATDIRSQARQREEIESARTAARALLESGLVPLLAVDPLGVVTDASASVEALTGRSRQQMVGTSAVGYAADPARAQALFRDVLRDGRVSGRELALRRPDGSEVTVLVSGIRQHGEDGKLRGLLATFADLTEQRRLREDLRRSRAYYRNLLGAAADGLATVDADGRIADVTRQVCALSGYEREELIGGAFADCFSDVPRARQVAARGLAGEPVAETELALVTKHGSARRVSVSVTRVDVGDGARLVASLRDVTEQAGLRDRLARERAYNRSVIEASANGLLVCDLRHVITDVNPTMCQLAGRSRDALLGTPVAECFAEPAEATAALSRALAGGGITNAELRLAGPGRPLALVNVSVLPDGAAPGGMLVSVRDVSELARLRRDLDAERAYARTLIETSWAPLFVVHAGGVVADVNMGAGRLTGYSGRRLLGRSFGALFTDPDRVAQLVARAFEEGYARDEDLLLTPVNAPPRAAAVSAARFTDPRDGQSALIAVVHDTSEDRAVRERLRLYTQLLYRATSDALLIADPLGVITDVNHPMEVLTGRDRPDLVGRSVEECFADPGRAHEFVATVLREGRVTDFELTVRPSGGDATVLWYSAATFTDSAGRLEGIFASGRDITERKRFEELQARMLEQARELDLAKSDFVSRVSHELRSPLTSVLGYLELLAGGEPGPLTAEQRKMMEVIYRNGRRLLRLIEDLLLLSRIESGAVTILYEPVRLGELVDGVRESYLPAIRRGQLTCTVQVEPDLVVEGDPAQLERVVSNLVSNAVKFTPPGGRISLRGRRRGEEALIEVADTGIGVPQAEQGQMFDRFFRSSISAERETQGTGLGLFIVKEVVQAHRGTVTVTSAPGDGATITVTLPIRRPPPGKAGRVGAGARNARER